MKRIVVGTDGSDGARRAVEWAAAEARLRGAPLTVLSSWIWPAGAYAGMAWAGSAPELADEFRARAEANVEKACSGIEGVDVTPVVAEGPAVQALLDAAADAELLVVGTRGHGGFVGLLLGSVSQQCAHHSPCPIVIVPPHER